MIFPLRYYPSLPTHRHPLLPNAPLSPPVFMEFRWHTRDRPGSCPNYHGWLQCGHAKAWSRPSAAAGEHPPGVSGPGHIADGRLLSFVFSVLFREILKRHLKIITDNFSQESFGEILAGMDRDCRIPPVVRFHADMRAPLPDGGKSGMFKKSNKFLPADNGKHQTPCTISTSRKPTKVLRDSGCESSMQSSMASLIRASASSIVLPNEWQPLNCGQDTMKTPSSSVSIMMGTWIVFI